MLELEPAHHPVRVLRAGTSKTLGRLDEAEQDLRAVLQADADSASAWIGLFNLKAIRADGTDSRAIARLYASETLDPTRRIGLGYAYASVLEAEARYPEAFAVLAEANAAKRRSLRWDAAAVSALVDAILAAFAQPPPAAPDARGADVIFLVGLPRSGSTLAEQILAAHPRVAGGGETNLLSKVLQDESTRRGQRFPAWVGMVYGGGLVGFTTGDVSDAYATGSVTVTGSGPGGQTGAGGLAGGNRGTIRHTWASGAVTSSGSNVGGLVGLAMDGTVDDSYWDRFSTGQANGVGVVDANATVTNVVAVTSDPAQSAAANYAFKQGPYASLDFVDTWAAFDGTRPFLQGEWQTTLGNAHQLQLMSLKLDANYTLGRNIDAGETGRNDGTAANSNGMWAQTGFMRVGTDGPRFVGSLDGRYHVISGFAINRPTIDGWVGLFGKTGEAVVKNLGMANVSIVGSSAVGGLIGLSQGGSVSNVYVTGSVSGAGAVGGIVGGMQGGSLDNAYASVGVSSAGNYVGGVTGGNQGASISDVYASGSVSGPNAAGLVGYNADASGAVINDGFWNTDVMAQGIGTADTPGGLSNGVTGLSTLHWLSQGPVATGLWNTANGWVTGYPYPVLKGFPYVLVVAQGTHVTQGVPAVTVDSYAVIDQDGNDASALVDGTPTWFADPGLAVGATANIGGTGVTMLDPSYQLTYVGSGVVQAPAQPNLTLALTQGGPDYVTYGQIVDYVVTLSNNGNAAAANYAVSASYGGGADVGATTWQCIAGSIDASCTVAGNGPIVDHVTVPPGVSMTWLIHVPVSPSSPAGTLDFDFNADGLAPLSDHVTIVIFRDGFDGAGASMEGTPR